MRRRHFITLLGSALLSSPLVARAQRAKTPVIGYMHSGSPGPFAYRVDAFRQGLREFGFVEGQNLAIEYRWAEGQTARLPAMAAELVARPVDVLVAVGGNVVATTVKAATSKIPIIFSSGVDPVQSGLVASLNRPGGNATGIYALVAGLEAKKLGLLRELLPAANLLGALTGPSNATAAIQQKDVDEAARAVGQKVIMVQAKSAREIEAAFTSLAQSGIKGLVVCSDPFFDEQRKTILALAARHNIPAIYTFREYVDDGGLMAYGTDPTEFYRQTGVYAARVLKGEKPADLPVMQSSKFEFVINLKTAKALGIDVPGALSARADSIIE